MSDKDIRMSDKTLFKELREPCASQWDDNVIACNRQRKWAADYIEELEKALRAARTLLGTENTASEQVKDGER